MRPCIHAYIHTYTNMYINVHCIHTSVVSKLGFQWSPGRHLTEMQGLRSLKIQKSISCEPKHKKPVSTKAILAMSAKEVAVTCPIHTTRLASRKQMKHTLAWMDSEENRSTTLHEEGTYRNILWGSIKARASHVLEFNYANKRRRRQR